VEALNDGQVDDDGVEAAFEVITDINERYAPFSPSATMTNC
jgi:hypothetical protein